MSAEVLPDVCRDYRMTIRLDAASYVRHDAGWIYAWGTASMVGVLAYPEFGTREFRDEAETFDPASMATLLGVPLTLDHPDPAIDEGLVTPATVRALAHGWVLAVERRGNDLRVQVCIASDEALAVWQSGVRELSCGYRSRYQIEPGEWEGPDGPEAYTGRQRQIRYNHLALVQTARAGHNARLDAALATRSAMNKITLPNGKIVTIPSFVADSIAAQAAKHNAAVEAGQVRRDAIETGTITIDGTDLTLPAAQIAAIVAMITGSASAPEPAGAEGAVSTDEDAINKPDEMTPAPPHMDAKAIDAAVARALAAAVPKLVESEVRSYLDAASDRERIVRLAGPLLGEAFDATGLDTYGVAAAAVVRADGAQREDVERLAAAARRGDQRAAGRLEERLEHTVRVHRDSSAGRLGLSIDSAHAAAATRVDAGVEVDALELARRRCNHPQTTAKAAKAAA